MRQNFANYAQRLCVHFLQLMRTLCTPLSALYYTHLEFNIDNATISGVYHKHVTFI